VTLTAELLHLLVPATELLDAEDELRRRARAQLTLDGLPARPEPARASPEAAPVVTPAQALALVRRLLGAQPL
jgi:hypothetical protein